MNTADPSASRRRFLQKIAATTVVTSGLGYTAWASRTRTLDRRPMPVVAPNDRIRIATIGMGIIGFIDTDTALQVPGVELVAVADLYEGRRVRTREVYGPDVATYVDYREILARDDVDAVLVCTPDHWHRPISIEAMEAGKAVYCEKPMVHTIEEGPAVIQAQQRTGQVFQVGSQFASSVLYEKVRDLIAGGAIGTLNMVEARYNRNSSIGAWQYSIPTDASPETVDWDRFLGTAPKRPFDPVRFFRWRNYWDYGTGVAGDLYVHLFTAIHYVLDALGPTRVMATGGLRHWKDGRDVPDVHMALFDYPEAPAHPPFTLALQVNFVDGGGGGSSFRFIGDEGMIEVDWGELRLSQVGMHRHTAQEVLEGYNSVRTFSEAQQKAFAEQYRATHPRPVAPEVEAAGTYRVPRGYDDRFDHFTYFFEAMRNGRPVFEDAVFGYRAAAPALLSNLSYRDGHPIRWDPVAMRVPG